MNTKCVLSLLATIFAACLIGTARADVRLPTIFSDHMVLKKSAKVPIWGTADPGEQLTVTLGGQSVQATAGPDGKWNAALDLSHSKPGPFEFSVEGKNKLTVSDVVVGEVWIASGQSNMSWALKDPPAAGEEIAASANPLIRQFLVTRKPSPGRLGDVEGSWTVASPATTGAFSSVGYFFARRLQRELKVPVGFINTSVGGSALEPWLSVEAINSVPDLKSTAESLWNAQRDFPGKRRAFVEAMDLWIKEAGRADKSEANVSAFAGLDASTQGWIPVTLPGPVQAPGLPDAGIVWLRKDIDLSAERARLDNFLRIPLDGFDSVYWNGELIKKTTYQEFPYPGYVRFRAPFVIPPAKQKVGKNVLAIRLYQPVGPAKFTGPVMVGPTNFIGEWLSKIEPLTLSGEWLAKAEFEFPPIEAKNTVATPVLPAINAQQVASIWFNGMVAPLIPYAISGVVWYQGESNADRAWQYRTSFPLLITDWRKQWAQGDFPFYFCQLANFKAKQPEPEESKWAELRAAQSSALTLPKTGQAILIDIGESNDIHPANKKDVGERLAAIALAKDYGKAIPFSGPVYDSVHFENGKAILRFQPTEGGLVARPLPATFDVETKTQTTAPLVRNNPGSELEGFAICGEDKKWVWAEAKIEKDRVVVWSDKVPSPIAVRYAWADNPTCNLSNGAGFPASPFRTDDFPATTLNGKY